MQKDILALFWRTTKPFSTRRNFAIFLVLFSVVTEGYIAPYILSQFINMLQAGSITLNASIPLIIAYGGTLLASTVISWRLTLWLTWSFEVLATRNLASKVLKHLMGHSLNFHANRFGGSIISQTTKLLSAFERFWDTIIWDLLPIVASITAAVTILSFIYWQYALFLLIVSIIFGFSVLFGSRFLRIRNERETEAWNKMTGFVADVVTNISTVKAFGASSHEHASMQKRTAEWGDRSFDSMRGLVSVSTIWSSLIMIIYVCALGFAAVAGEHHSIKVGAVYLMLTYTLGVGRNLWSLNHVMRQYNSVMGDASAMTKELKLEYDIKDKTANTLKAAKGKISFNDVTFAHDGGAGEGIFNNLTLTIKPGERIGLVGHSGSGKTTLTRLLLRFSDIDGGSISIDDQDIAEVTQQSLHQSIAYVAQEPLLFHRTLAENIAYGKPDATREQIIRAAKQAHAWEFIQKLPEGLETMVGERGIKLSGGQRQRVAIARALLKDAPILVLDEATSALDSESEKLIQESLDTLMQKRTSIVIAHRLSTIAQLDRIIVLEHGKIAEDGSHQELIAKKGIYASLWKHQSGGFIEADE
jgi:ATP-binding cassette subfamily B protein